MEERKSPPKEFLDKYKVTNINFVVDEIEEEVMTDAFRFGDEFVEKFNKNVTQIVRRWIQNKIKKKENISVSTKGDTRGGKSLANLALIDDIIDTYGKDFNTQYIVCGNQREYRMKLADEDTIEFGDTFLIDENAFTAVGEGAYTEMAQLLDTQNIIPKRGIHTFYVTPKEFLNNNSILGLRAYGKDLNNWLTRMIVYDLRNRNTTLIGYMIVDIGKLFRKYGCYVYKETGGCTNPANKKSEEISEDAVKYSHCIGKSRINDSKKSDCPFYGYCKHPLADYERKKDEWIRKQMKGGMSEREMLHHTTAIDIMPHVCYRTEEGLIKTDENLKKMSLLCTFYAPDIGKSVFNKSEQSTIANLIFMYLDTDRLKSACEKLELNFDEKYNNIPLKDSMVKLDQPSQESLLHVLDKE